MLNHLSSSQRETKTNASKLEALETKVNRLIEQQLLLLKHLNIKDPGPKSEPLKSSFKKHHRSDSQISPESAIFDYIDEEPGDTQSSDIVRESSVRISLRGDETSVSRGEDAATEDPQPDDGGVMHVDAQVQVEYPSASKHDVHDV